MSGTIPTVELTADQKRKWEEVCSLMAWVAPGFRHIWYKLLVNHDGQYSAVFTKLVPVAATDQKNILLNPDTFFAMGLPECVYVLCHEVLHNVYNDVDAIRTWTADEKVRLPNGKSVDFEEGFMQQAMDYRSNALLTDSKMGRIPIATPKLIEALKKNGVPPDQCPKDGEQFGWMDKNIATAEASVVDVYSKIYKKKPSDKPGDKQGKAGGSGQGGGGPGKQGFDKILPPGTSTGQDPHTASQDRNPQQWATELMVAKHLEQEKSQGNMPGALTRMFEELLTPQIPWQEHIRGFVARRLGSGGYDYRRPDRRLIVRDIYAPSRSGYGCNWLVVGGDGSGSIGQPEMDTYFAETGGILDGLRPRRLTVIWWDTKIGQIDELTDTADLAEVRRKGVANVGGGSDSRPLFDWIEQEAGFGQQPDALICFTDAHIMFPPHAPSYPVVWGVTTDQECPFGEVVRINPTRKGA